MEHFFRKSPNKGAPSKIVNSLKKKIRRGRGVRKSTLHSNMTNLSIIGNNTAGLTGKLDSLKRLIQVFNPAVILLQETKYKTKGKLRLEGFEIFEQLRENNNEGGGLMSIIHKNLSPIQIPDEHQEFLIVDIFEKFGSIRTINCYGPQENWSMEARTGFFIELESRIISARQNEKLICIEFDANSKIGQEIIPGDPNIMSPNGKLLFDILKRQNLVIVNATEKCEGIITRYKKTVKGVEQSVIDYFVVCQELYKNVLKMQIDDKRQYVLSRFYKYKTKTTTVESDHNILILYLSFKLNQKIQKERREIYNVRNESYQKIFNENTSNNPKLIKILQNANIYTAGAKWIKEVNHLVAISFKKIRISNIKPKPNMNIVNLLKMREKFKLTLSKLNNDDEKTISEVRQKLDGIENEIADIKAEENFKLIKEHVEHLIDDTENLNSIQMWKLKKKLCPFKSEPPMAKKNKFGEIVNKPVLLKELYENTYKERLRHRSMKPELVNMYNLKMQLFNMRLEVAKNVKSEQWTKENLLNVVKSLKKSKSADPHGLIYELFKPGIIGTDLFTSLLMLCNSVKEQLIIPNFVTYTDITSIYKQKGEKSDLENDRGIFSVSKVRSIIEKLVYQDIYETIDNAMSDSNVGGRRNRNIRDNLMVIYAVIHDAVKNKKETDIQFYDISKCFDAMWTHETMNDIFDAGLRGDKFVLMSIMNSKCQVRVKTPVGGTDRFELNDIEMQGTVPAPLKCAVQVETLGRYCYTYDTGIFYYKDACAVPPLGMIDDIAGVAKCQDSSVVLNAIINSKIESKKLEFNMKKCFNMHVGPNSQNCPALKIHENQMKATNTQLYLGDVISSLGNNSENIKERCKKGFQAISQIKSMMKDISMGKFTIQIGLIFRDSIFVSKMLLNSEVWHNLTQSQVNDLEKVDRILLRHTLDAHSKTGIEWLYCDTGKLNLGSHIKIRRLMYLWHILSRDESELIRRVYTTQKISHNAGDWFTMVEKDKKQLGIDMTDAEIQGVSKQVFKRYVTKKV